MQKFKLKYANSCGNPDCKSPSVPLKEVYASNEDVARNGAGICFDCHTINEKPAKYEAVVEPDFDDVDEKPTKKKGKG